MWWGLTHLWQSSEPSVSRSSALIKAGLEDKKDVPWAPVTGKLSHSLKCAAISFNLASTTLLLSLKYYNKSCILVNSSFNLLWVLVWITTTEFDELTEGCGDVILLQKLSMGATESLPYKEHQMMTQAWSIYIFWYLVQERMYTHWANNHPFLQNQCTYTGDMKFSSVHRKQKPCHSLCLCKQTYRLRGDKLLQFWEK